MVLDFVHLKQYLSIHYRHLSNIYYHLLALFNRYNKQALLLIYICALNYVFEVINYQKLC